MSDSFNQVQPSTASGTNAPREHGSRLTGALMLMSAQAVVLILGYITHPLVGRFLGQAAYGVYGVILSVQSIVGLFLTLGVPTAVARFVARDEEHAQSVLRQSTRIQIAFALCTALALLVLSSPIARALDDSSLTRLLMFASLVIAAQAFYPLYVQFLSGMHLFNRQAMLMVLYAVVKLIGAITLLFIWGVAGAFSGFLVGGLVAGGVGWYWTRRLGGRVAKQLPWRDFLSFGSTYVLILVGLQLLISLDLFMVKAFLHDDAQAGFYNAAVTLSRIPYLLLQALNFVILPSVSKLTKPGESRAQAAAFISDTIRYLIALVVPAVALASATSKSLIIIFFSHAYIPSAPVLTILMVGLGSLAFYLMLATIAAGAGRARIALAVTGALLIVSSSLGLFLIPRFGLVGAAWQTTLTGLLGLAVFSLYTFRVFSLRLPLRTTCNVVLATAVALIPTYLWQADGPLVFIQYAAAGVLYIAGLVLLSEFTPHDRRRLVAMLPQLNRWTRLKK